MNTTLLINLSGETYQRVDLYEDLPIQVVIQQLDIVDFQQRKSQYSKTFLVPGTSQNSILFEHYFEVNGIEFNPLLKIPAVVQYRGQDIFQGILRLNAVIQSPNSLDYELYLMGDVGDFTSTIKNTTLNQLDFTDLQHEQNYTNIALSWNGTPDGGGLFDGQVVYPLVNWGYYYQDTTSAATPSFTIDFGKTYSFDQSAYGIPTEYFKPAIRLKTLVDKIFAQTDYNIASEFFETDYFKSIYVDTFVNGQLGIEAASAVTNQNIFKSYSPNQDKHYLGNNARKTFIPQFSTNLSNGYDPLGNFNNSFGFFTAPYAGNYYFNLRFNYESKDPLQTGGRFRVVVNQGQSFAGIVNTGSTIYVSDEYKIGIKIPSFTFENGSVNIFFSASCSPGDVIFPFLEETVPYFSVGLNLSTTRGQYILKPFNQGGVVDPFIMWDLYNSPTLTGTQTVDFKLGVPNLNSIDFLKSLILHFNLVLIQDEASKTIRMEPYPWYYDETNRDEKDWTQRLDLNSSYRIEPLSFDLSKEIELTYVDAQEENLNKLFSDKYDYVFGRKKYVSDSNLLTGDKKYVSSFAALPTESLENAPNIVIPSMYRQQANQKTPYSFKPHMFFWCGNRFAYTDVYKTQPGYWYINDNGTPRQQSTYPQIHHLSSLDVQFTPLLSDLNFSSDFDFYGNTNTQLPMYTENTTYNLYWKDYIENNYSLETRRFTGKFFLRPFDIADIDLTDKIYVKDSFYRIDKINDASLIDNKLTNISLIKELGGYYKVESQAPFYAISGNTPYPGLPLAYSGDVYTATTVDVLCASGGTLENVITFGFGGFANLQQVWIDAGTYYKPMDMGIYLRPSGTTDNYVVIDKQGRILEIDC